MFIWVFGWEGGGGKGERNDGRKTCESVLNRTTDCRTRKEILRVRYGGTAIVARHMRSGRLLYSGDYGRGTICSVFGAADLIAGSAFFILILNSAS